MSQPLLLNISSDVNEIADLLTRLELASPEELAQLAGQIEAFTESELIRFVDNVLVFTNDVNLLSMVYDSPAVIGKIGASTVVKLYTDLYMLHQELVISEAVYQRLAASLISHYPNKRNLNLLKDLQPIVAANANGKVPPQHNPGAAFDEAMARQVQSAPYKSTEELFKSWDSLRAFELPKTLEVFVRQMLADSEMEQVRNLVIEFYQLDKLPHSYIDVFRRVLGDDVFIGFCTKANATEVRLASAAKIVPFAGEEVLHTPEFLNTLKSQIASPYQSGYLKGFAGIDCDDQTFPILAAFVLENLQLVLKESLMLIRLGSTLPVVRLAHRHGLDDRVLECVIESARAKIGKHLLEDVSDMNLTELVDSLTQNAFEPYPEAQLAAMYERLQDVIEVVGLETVKRVTPDVDHRFILYVMDKGRTDLSKAQVLKMFPHIKGPLLEDELGL
jgi:N-acetyl-anhydromuramyl-L-alanine amidase AmpD